MRSSPSLPRRKLWQIASGSLPGAGVALPHWTMEDTGTTVADLYGKTDLTASSTAVVDAPIYETTGAALGKGRDTSGSLTISGASYSQDQRDALMSSWTYEGIVTVNSLSTDDQCLVAHRGGATASSSNALIWLSTRTDGRIHYRHEHGVRVVDECHSRVGAVTAGLHHLAVRKRVIGTTIWISFFVDGAHAGTESLSNQATDGVSGSWSLGMQNSGGSARFNGEIYETRIVAGAMSDAFVRENAARALRLYDVAGLLSKGTGCVYARMLVENPLGPADGTDTALIDVDDLFDSGSSGFAAHEGMHFFDSIEISDSIDQPGASATFRLSRELYKWSLSPGMADTSPISSDSGYKVFDAARRVRADVAIVPYGTEYDDVAPWAWTPAFDGFISAVKFGDEQMEVDARDLIAPIQWTFCRPLASNSYEEKTYGNDTSGVAIETVIQAIIDDHVPAGGMKGGAPLLYTPTSPSWSLRKRAIGFVPLYDAITDKAEQIGWVLREKWDDNWKQWRLTLYEPDRSSPTVLKTFGVDDYEGLTQADYDESEIRNVVEVIYTNRLGTPDASGNYPRARYTSSNSTSIAQYGERYSQVSEDAASQIDTATEAQKLADALVGDLAQPIAICSATCPFLFDVELNDYYGFETDGVHFDTTVNLAVTGIKHTIDNAEAWGETVLSLRGLPSGGHARHFGKIAHPGVAPYAPFKGVDEASAPTVTKLESAAHVKWTLPAGPHGNFDHDLTEVHASTTNGFTPSSSTLKATTRANYVTITNLTPGVQLYWCLVHVDRSKNRTPSAQLGTGVTPRLGFLVPAFACYASSTQALTVGTTSGDRLVFGTTEFDAAGNIDTTAARTRFTAPYNGIYTFTVEAVVTTTGTADRAILMLYKNGDTADGTGVGTKIAASRDSQFLDYLGKVPATLTAHVQLNAGDTVVVKYADSGKCTTATLQSGATVSRFSGAYVGPIS